MENLATEMDEYRKMIENMSYKQQKEREAVRKRVNTKRRDVEKRLKDIKEIYERNVIYMFLFLHHFSS